MAGVGSVEEKGRGPIKGTPASQFRNEHKFLKQCTHPHPGVQKPPSQCGKVLPILQVRALDHQTQMHHQHRNLVIKSSVKMSKEKIRHGKKSNVSTGMTTPRSHGFTSHGVIVDWAREFEDPCRWISACRDPFCKLLGPSHRVSCCSVLQINEKSYFTYTVSEGHYLQYENVAVRP